MSPFQFQFYAHSPAPQKKKLRVNVWNTQKSKWNSLNLTSYRFNRLLLGADYQSSVVRESGIQLITVDVTREGIIACNATMNVTMFVGFFSVFSGNHQRSIDKFDVDLVGLEISQRKSYLSKEKLLKITCLTSQLNLITILEIYPCHSRLPGREQSRPLVQAILPNEPMMGKIPIDF